MDVATIKRRAALGVVFLALRTVFVQLCILGSTVVLARALTPAEFGVYAILRFALTFFEFFGDAGIGGALVRKEAPPTRDELSNVFTFQCLVAGTLVVVVWLVASGIELIWSELPAGSAWLLRAMSLALLLTAARVAPAVLMERSLKFGHIALLEMLQTVAFYGVACALAVMGFGVRAWVYALLAQSATGLVGAYLMNPWRPGIELRWNVLRPLVAFGVPYQLKGLISFANSAVTPLYAGAALGPMRLGYINWGLNTGFFSLKIVEIMSRVSFPLFSRVQNDPRLLRKSMETSLQICALGPFFCIALFTAMGPNVTEVIFTKKWLPGLPALYLYSWALGIGFISPVIGAAFDAMGRPGIIARLAIFWTALNWLVVPIATTRWGMIGFVAGNCVHILFGNLAVVVVARRMLPGIRIVRPLLPPLVGALGAFALAWFWTRHWAWGPASMTAAVSLLLIVDLAITALLARRAVVDAIQLFAPAKTPAVDS